MSEKSGIPATQHDWHPYSPHLTSKEVRKLVDSLEVSEGARRRELITRMAWRPAWAIRSRRGSLKPFLSLFVNFFGKKKG